jgi:hypothetical protein
MPPPCNTSLFAGDTIRDRGRSSVSRPWSPSRRIRGVPPKQRDSVIAVMLILWQLRQHPIQTRQQVMASAASDLLAGGTIFLSASGPTPTSPTKAGWARLTSSGGSLSAVARYEFAVGPVLTTAVEVPQSLPLQVATVQVDSDGARSKYTAWAVANPGSQFIKIGHQYRSGPPGSDCKRSKGGGRQAISIHSPESG